MQAHRVTGHVLPQPGKLSSGARFGGVMAQLGPGEVQRCKVSPEMGFLKAFRKYTDLEA